MKKDLSVGFIWQLTISLLFAAYFFSSAALAGALIAALRLLTAPFDRQGKLTHTLTRALAAHYIQINPGWRAEVRGAERLVNMPCSIIVANHQSLLDVLVLSRLPAFYKWVAKAQVWNMVGVGQLMRANSYVPVCHGDLKSVRQMLRQCRQYLLSGVSIFIFPEGERSLDGRLLRFKDGPFKLACETDTPIQPVVLDGTIGMMRRGSPLIFFRAPVRITVLPAIYPASVGYDAQRLNAAVHAAIAAALGQSEDVSMLHSISSEQSVA